MRIVFKIEQYGFCWDCWHRDFDYGDFSVFHLTLWFGKQYVPFRSWRLSYNDSNSQPINRSIVFRTYHKGKHDGWSVCSPLQRLNY